MRPNMTHETRILEKPTCTLVITWLHDWWCIVHKQLDNHNYVTVIKAHDRLSPMLMCVCSTQCDIFIGLYVISLTTLFSKKSLPIMYLEFLRLTLCSRGNCIEVWFYFSEPFWLLRQFPLFSLSHYDFLDGYRIKQVRLLTTYVLILDWWGFSNNT